MRPIWKTVWHEKGSNKVGGLSLDAANAQQDRQITIAFEGGAVTMDPHKRQETTTLAWQQHLYEYLIRMSREGELMPKLATSWEARRKHLGHRAA